MSLEKQERDGIRVLKPEVGVEKQEDRTEGIALGSNSSSTGYLHLPAGDPAHVTSTP